MGPHGKHVCDVRRYGIDPEVLYRETASYIERFRLSESGERLVPKQVVDTEFIESRR